MHEAGFLINLQPLEIEHKVVESEVKREGCGNLGCFWVCFCVWILGNFSKGIFSMQTHTHKHTQFSKKVLVGQLGFEPRTLRLRAVCSTN